MPDEKAPSEFWKQWWNDQAKASTSDYALNRMTSIRLGKLEQREFEQFLTAVQPSPTDLILDAGCGTGRNVSILSPSVGHITGIDYSEEMVRRANERITSEKLCNAIAQQGDVTAMNFPSHTFDKVVCTSVLQYLNEAECSMAIREMIRVCKQNGTLVLHIKNGTSLYGLSLAIIRPIAHIFGRKMKPEFYRSRRWHFSNIETLGGTIRDFYGFGIFTFVPLPQKIVGFLLKCEIALPFPKFLQRFAVNFKITVDLGKPAAS